MPSLDSSSSSGSSTASLSSPRVPLTDLLLQQQQQQTPLLPLPMRRTATTAATAASIPASQGCVTRYKTELCRPFTETGKCKYGDKCQFSHGMKELRNVMRHPKYKTEYCRTFHTTGYCPYGPRCHFIHDVHETRPVLNNTDSTLRRHSDLRINSVTPKSTPRNRFHSDDRPYSDQPLTSPSSSSSPSKFPFTFEELSQALLSYDAAEVFSAEALLYPSLSSNFTRRTFSSSSSSNSS